MKNHVIMFCHLNMSRAAAACMICNYIVASIIKLVACSYTARSLQDQWSSTAASEPGLRYRYLNQGRCLPGQDPRYGERQVLRQD
jgi:hypothetical protein